VISRKSTENSFKGYALSGNHRNLLEKWKGFIHRGRDRPEKLTIP